MSKPPRLEYARLAEIRPDSTAQFLDWFKTPMPYSGLFEYYRREAKAAEQRRQPRPAHTVPQPGSMEWFAEQNKRK